MKQKDRIKQLERELLITQTALKYKLGTHSDEALREYVGLWEALCIKHGMVKPDVPSNK